MRPPATCHPDRAHCAKGLCRTCWERQRKPRDPKKKAAYCKAWKEKNREHVRASERIRRATKPAVRASARAAQVRRDFGLSREAYEAMLSTQKGCCKICGGKNKSGWALHVDHCHETGQVRSLLCGPCNMVVGWAEQRGGEDAAYALAEYVRTAALKGKEAA